MNSIQTKLTAAFLTLFLVSLSALGGLNYWKAKNLLSESVTQSISVMADTSSDNIGSWLEARRMELTMMSCAPIVSTGNPEAMVHYLADAVKANKVYEAIGFAMPTGLFYNSAGSTGNLADREAFQRTIKGETVITNPIVSKSTGHLITAVEIPVKVDGKIIGVLYGTINLDDLAKQISALKVGQTGYAFVIQGDGTPIIHPDKEVVFKQNALKSDEGDLKQKELISRMVKKEKGVVLSGSRENEKFTAFSPVPGVDWSLGLTVPVSEVTNSVSTLKTIALYTIVIVLLIAMAFITWFARRISKPIQKLETAANRIAAGDLSKIKVDIKANDEIGRLGHSFEQMAQNLQGLIQQVRGATEQVSASSEQLTASSGQAAQAANQVAETITNVATGAENQLKAVDETTNIVEQLSAGVQEIAANASNVAATAQQTSAAAQEGGKAVQQVTDQMASIEKSVEDSAKMVDKLGVRSQEIGKIVDTISGITGQTTLLALNAAIEAARAGEQGRGFAVVAEEVRKLAEQSQEAAKQIAEMIHEIQSDTEKAVNAMNEGTSQVKMGTAVVNDTGRTFDEIMNLVSHVSDQVNDISAAIEQMAASSQNIVTAVRDIDKISKQSSAHTQTVSAATEEQLASMEEIASSSQLLARLAENLKKAVNKFKI